MVAGIVEAVDGVAIPGNRSLSAAERQARIDTFFRPYHQAVEGRLRMLAARGPVPAVISLHSFTPVMDGFERPWQVAALSGLLEGLKDRDPPVPLSSEAQAALAALQSSSSEQVRTLVDQLMARSGGQPG